MLQTEFEFTLPHGFVDEQGNLHRQGIMRRATALDEVASLGDPRVQANDAYLGILLLSRVIERLGTLDIVEPKLVEQLFAPDFAYLQELYTRVNALEADLIETQCPTCGTRLVLDLAGKNGG